MKKTIETTTFKALSNTIYLFETVTFEATNTTRGLKYKWDFDDGTFEIGGHKISNEYRSSGTKSVRLEIDKLMSSAKMNVYPGNISYQIKNESNRIRYLFVS